MSEVHIVQTFRVPTYHKRADKNVCALFSSGYQYILTSSFSISGEPNPYNSTGGSLSGSSRSASELQLGQPSLTILHAF